MSIRYDENTKARAVRLVREHRDDYDSEWAAMRAIAGSPRTYWAYRSAAPSKRALWHTTITEILAGYYEPDADGKRPPESLYGSLKMWPHLQRQGIPVARRTVERIMRHNGWRGVTRARRAPRGVCTNLPPLFLRKEAGEREVTPFGVVDGTVPRVEELSEPSERGQHVGPPTVTMHRLQDTRHRSCGSHRAQGRCSLRQGDSRPHQSQRDRQGRTKLLEPKGGSREEQPDSRPQRGRYRPPPFTDRIGASGIVGRCRQTRPCTRITRRRRPYRLPRGMSEQQCRGGLVGPNRLSTKSRRTQRGCARRCAVPWVSNCAGTSSAERRTLCTPESLHCWTIR